MITGRLIKKKVSESLLWGFLWLLMAGGFLLIINSIIVSRTNKNHQKKGLHTSNFSLFCSNNTKRCSLHLSAADGCKRHKTHRLMSRSTMPVVWRVVSIFIIKDKITEPFPAGAPWTFALPKFRKIENTATRLSGSLQKTGILTSRKEYYSLPRIFHNLRFHFPKGNPGYCFQNSNQLNYSIVIKFLKPWNSLATLEEHLCCSITTFFLWKS